MNKLHSKKLLNSKWTSVSPENKEKHFLITEVGFTEDGDVERCIIEAIISKRSMNIDWQDLKDQTVWLQGWK